MSATEISIATLLALGQSLMQLSAFQTNLGLLLLLVPRLIIFKNRIAFLNENHVTKLLMALGSKPRVLFQVSHLHRRQEDAGSEAVSGGYVSL